ncbi:hypothetical protein A3H80_01280 [Candidatus Roizmanbacteria bacterium RIFCSPLOWO2_02_FULL_37_19]|uniref:Uncharacterized protein n=1 Tax=Candidatus Roizmanbacteria bacterium RIFCSPHIGHO2_02_FULL_37_24 TaxID=1802037 RepID=A0A1F7GUC8_9BACT|nr:MAG: hypothetical protein A2862_00520 [Candidatus Roizmanbacteria bacterium RIFCSPHIGHO2_01_FULL_38_41]OGK22568.1 MAG: hypothetical protein A3C24_05400 [Candidatus Roizmanbacteria bacterium RIFCSPHIGHO2_02_FULL_37_24]OGK32709.1 MAG: hypothetical protein A3E10_00285 [Candidatus Roizmanbacteria bacterium RIFCSPHIGHO2_12_FULL_37_23]OGK54231.1 MAG: hypothetical protein A3H80_01280 [Candidatus Roizmanbacteria bacterium RIFCSPLOWO2_02_FULL_37_19]OGK58842.1 MAG: hypothetical protein A3G65_01975 [Ca
MNGELMSLNGGSIMYRPVGESPLDPPDDREDLTIRHYDEAVQGMINQIALAMQSGVLEEDY